MHPRYLINGGPENKLNVTLRCKASSANRDINIFLSCRSSANMGFELYVQL